MYPLDDFSGMKVVVDDLAMSTVVDDWSDCRSRSRAERRARKGHKQRVVSRIIPKPDALIIGEMMIVHSETYRKIRAASVEAPAWPG